MKTNQMKLHMLNAYPHRRTAIQTSALRETFQGFDLDETTRVTAHWHQAGRILRIRHFYSPKY